MVIKSTIPYLHLLLLLPLIATAIGEKVGGRRQVEDVEVNDEVQDLGRYCVREYNRQQQKANGSKLLAFSRVVEAETQVVSGIKYYLRISAVSTTRRRTGSVQTFEAVVVVKPWLRSKQLLEFVPSSQPKSTK